MIRTTTLMLLILCSTVVADAETYKWIDDQGVVSFTDNPALIPHKYRSKALNELKMKDTPAARERDEKKLQNELATPPADRMQSAPSSPEMQQENNGHLSGSQTDPAPPSMKQPVPEPLGDQPQATPLGMKQPKPAPLGDQPTPTPLGMEQPKPAPLGDQPTPTPLGMEQPTPAK